MGPFTNTWCQECSPDSIQIRNIKAFETDNNIDWELQNHLVYINPDCILKDELLIHLVGTFDNTANTTYFPILAANNGFPVIVLKYPNNTSAVGACANSVEIDCFEDYRKEIIWGIDSSDAVDVDSVNSIIHRINRLLIYLNENYPAENWGQFIQDSGEIIWDDILLSGHSQGEGHAAFIAKEYSLKRVLMFASPNDYSDYYTAPATWLSNLSSTPDSCYYVFANLNDNTVDFNKQYANWTAMHLLDTKDSINVDFTTCNYNQAQILYTEYTSSFGLGNHSSMIIDSFIPLSGGIPTFLDVWKYMLGICDIPSKVSILNEIYNVRVFPNPTTSHVTIESESVILSIELVDFNGQVLRKEWPGQKCFDLDLKDFKGFIMFRVILKKDSKPIIKMLEIR